MKSGKPAFVPETFVDFEHAYRLILALGGIPCYPTLVDGSLPMCGYEENVEALISNTRARGIFCTELIPVRNSPEQVVRYVMSMRQAGFIVTAGTEHNTRDLIPMTPTCAHGAEIPNEIQEIFWEGACVIAAHQYLTTTGRPGYVDSAGQLAGEYGSADKRIEFLRELGAEVVKEVVGRKQ
jgi:cytochrome c551/c552